MQKVNNTITNTTMNTVIPICDISGNWSFSALLSFSAIRELHNINIWRNLNHFHLLLISACRDWAALPFSLTCIVLCLTGGVEHHRDCAGHEQVHRLSSAASADPLCRSLWQHRAPRTAGWLHVADYLQAVKRPLTHQSPKGCHWRVSAGNLQVRLL